MKKSPCRYCEERTPECHGTCQKYTRWRAERDRERRERNFQKELEYAVLENRIAKSVKAMKEWKKKGLK